MSRSAASDTASRANRGGLAWAGLRRAIWLGGRPLRAALVGAIRLYRLLLGGAVAGRCRFYPSCSHYAEGAIRARGAVAGGALAGWRLVRCHPWSGGGFDYPPSPPAWRREGAGPEPGGAPDGARPYESIIQTRGAA